MTAVPAMKTRVLHGSLHASGYAKKVGNKATTVMLDRTSLVDPAYVFQPGQDNSTFDLELMLDVDSSAGGQWSVGSTWKSTPTPFSFMPSVLTAGSEAWLATANLTGFNGTAKHDQLVMLAVSTQNDGPMDPGVVIEDLNTISADTNGASVDNGAATSNGGVWHIHVTAFSGLTSDSIILEHSTDNSTWATLDTSTLVTAIGSERRVVAAGTTVRRHLRVRDDVTGTGSISRQVSFARR